MRGCELPEWQLKLQMDSGLLYTMPYFTNLQRYLGYLRVSEKALDFFSVQATEWSPCDDTLAERMVSGPSFQRFRYPFCVWPISTSREHILDSVEVPVLVNLFLFHSWKPYFFTISLFIFQTVSLTTAFQQMKSYMCKQCRCGCTGCSENHQNSFEGHEQQWHIWRGCLKLLNL